MSSTLSVRDRIGQTPDAFTELREAIAGRLVTPGDTDYDRARTPWLVNIEQRPLAVLEVAHADDVVAAVRWARRHGVSVTAQPTGHAARSSLDGALMLRTRGLGEIHVDATAQTARVGAGVKFGELCAALDDTGLMALAGSNADPTVVGLALGGGVSWFTRLHGFTANSVLSFDVVDADGDRVTVTATSDPELFWALRGGGGDFAIVLGVTISLFEAPELYGGQLLWPIEDAPAVLRAFRDLSAVAPRELTMWAHLLHFPDVELVPEPLRGRSWVNIAATYVGGRAMAEILLWSLRDAAPVAIDLMKPFAPSELTEVAAEPSDPTPALESSLLVSALDDRGIEDLLVAAGDRETTALAVVQIRQLGGAFADAAPGNGAVRPVTDPFHVFGLGMLFVPELEGPVRAGLATLESALGRLSSGHRLPNFCGEHQRSNDGYDEARLERLRAIKRARDPHGVIRSNKPVLAS